MNMGAVGSVSNVPQAEAAPAADAAQPNVQSWQASADAAAQQQTMDQMMGFASQIMMMPLVFQAMNAGQDDD